MINIKIMVIALMVAVFVSLATALYFLIQDRNTSQSMVTSLTIRIALSVLVFLLLLLGYTLGWIHPHGI
jgi:uncharacterized membrane protein